MSAMTSAMKKVALFVLIARTSANRNRTIHFESNRIMNTNSSDSLTIACVGDSLTVGSGSTGQRYLNAYPAILKKDAYFSGYNVHNYGLGGMCATKSIFKFSYWDTKQYRDAMMCQPAIVILMFGTNDAKYNNWNETLFKTDYISMIKGFQKLPTKPAIYLIIPPPMYTDEGPYNISGPTVNYLLPEIIPEIAKQCNVKVIDGFNALGGTTLSFPEAYMIDRNKAAGVPPNDMCHLNNLGYARIAGTVAQFLQADK
jgi:acyl-CoA thioesterase I